MDDEYDKKFAKVQKYIPFLEMMIEKLQNVRDTDSRHIQLQKIQRLHEILSDRTRKLRLETLQQCEDVLQKLYDKVQQCQGNPPSSIPSMSSSATVRQGTDTDAAWMFATEELSNIFAELVLETTENTSTDKGSEADPEDA